MKNTKVLLVESNLHLDVLGNKAFFSDEHLQITVEDSFVQAKIMIIENTFDVIILILGFRIYDTHNSGARFIKWLSETHPEMLCRVGIFAPYRGGMKEDAIASNLRLEGIKIDSAHIIGKEFFPQKNDSLLLELVKKLMPNQVR